MSTPIQAGSVHHGDIHFADRFPVTATPCGANRGPASTRWQFVDCEACLEAGPDDDRIRARLAHVRKERLAREAGGR